MSLEEEKKVVEEEMRKVKNTYFPTFLFFFFVGRDFVLICLFFSISGENCFVCS